MATTNSIPKGTNASGSHVATYSWSEDAVTKHGQRIILCDDAGRITGYHDSTVAPTTPYTATTSAGIGVAANTSRHGVILYNSGSVEVFFGFSSGLTDTNGIKIYPNGQFMLHGMGIYRGAIYFITSTSTTTIRAQEW